MFRRADCILAASVRIPPQVRRVSLLLLVTGVFPSSHRSFHWSFVARRRRPSENWDWGLPPPTRFYRDAVASVAVRPPPPPISFDSASFRPMGTLTRDQGMKVYGFQTTNCEAIFKLFGEAKVPVRPVERDGQQMPGPAREDLRVKLDAQQTQRAQRALDDRRRGKKCSLCRANATRPPPLGQSTSGGKGDGEEMCGDALHEDTPKPVMEEVVHSPEIVTGVTEGPGHISVYHHVGVDHQGVEDYD
ncbi:hypothetical protein Salat_1649100 [Sesamum alatum]|uniref:Uncharacterized protein n=1 Tax=Sesamum alatum TaxID=300844 RepID=A0AAE1Y6D8_9LAMI|nr:hypothetical protein Salat_1649100 [Sesamum alatum]